MTDLLMKRGATYNADRSLRFTLTREWSEGPRFCWIGHNPSTAGHEKDDPTSLAWVHFTKLHGGGSYVAANLYPLMSPSPAKCRSWAAFENNGPNYYARDAIMENTDIVAREAKAAAKVIACWGAIAHDWDWIEHVVEAIQSYDQPWPDIYCLGVTGSGAPKHPLARGKHRVSRDQELVLWRAA